MAKVTCIRIPGTDRGSIRGIGTNGNREFTLGYHCDSNWGGGVIDSMELVTPTVVRIKKSTPFVGPADNSGKRETFDFVHVVVSQCTVVDEPKPAQVESKPDDPPAAKPAQQQNLQRR